MAQFTNSTISTNTSSQDITNDDTVILKLCDIQPHDRDNTLHRKLTLKFKKASDRIVLITNALERFKKHRKIEEKLVRDLDFAFGVVKMEGTALRKLKNQDRRVALAAVQQNGNAYSYIKGPFQSDLECMIGAISTCGTRIARRILKQNTLSDEERMGLMKQMMNHNRNVNLVGLLQYMPSDYFKSLEFCIELLPKVKNHLFHFMFTPFSSDRDALLQLLRNCKTFDHNFPKFVDKSLWDKELVLEMVSRDGVSIEHVPRKLQADRDIILAAVKNSGNALMFAHPPHNADFEIVTAAVKSNARGFFYVDDELKSSKRFIEMCMRENADGFRQLRQYHHEIEGAFGKFGY